MRNMSCTLTLPQVHAGTKNVTRRLGWDKLKPGEHFMFVEKGMGLKKGEKVKRVREAVCISNTKEPLEAIAMKPWREDGDGRSEMEREGFPNLSSGEFVTMFCEHMKVEPTKIINRIAFVYTKEGAI